MAKIRIWVDTKGESVCKSCGGHIEWAEVVASGKKAPFDAPIVTVLTETDPESGRQIETVDTSVTKSHFASCPQSDEWRSHR